MLEDHLLHVHALDGFELLDQLENRFLVAGHLEQDQSVGGAETLGYLVEPDPGLDAAAVLGEQVLHLVGVMRGATVFMADLVRKLDLEVTYDYIAVHSYEGTSSTGVVKLIKDLDENVESRHVIVVEDIIDSGLTLNYIKENLQSRKPASLALITLLDRPHQRKIDLQLDYIGFTIPDKFVVGYGLDFEQKWRHLPDIWAIN